MELAAIKEKGKMAGLNFFEAFDEQWKGSSDPMEPEKHWGVFKADRTSKLVFEKI